MMDATKLMEERAALHAQARELIEAADGESRSLTAEESERVDTLLDEADGLKQRADELVADGERRARLDRLGEELERCEARSPVPTTAAARRDEPGDEAPSYAEAFTQFLHRGIDRITPEQRQVLRERREMSIGGGAGGASSLEGAALVAEEFNRQVQLTLNEVNAVRRLARVVQTSGDHNIAVQASKITASVRGEEAAYTESTPDIDQVTLQAWKMTALALVTEELLGDDITGVQSWLPGQMARAIAELEEQLYVSGGGSTEPTGLETQLASRTVATGAADATITIPNLIDLKMAVRRPYRNSNAAWLMSDAALGTILKLAGNDNYHWQPSLVAGEPDRLMGYPVFTSESVADPGSGALSIYFGDWSYCWVGDRGPRFMQRLDQRYADTGQVGFRMYQRADMKVTLAEALAVLTHAT